MQAKERNLPFLLIMVMAIVVLVVLVVACIVLYRTAFELERERLRETVQSQVWLIEAVARFDAQHSEEDHPAGASAATLSQIVEAHKKYERSGQTNEFTLARREGDTIVFLLRHRHECEGVESLGNLVFPLAGGLAQPMQRALAGESGTMVGKDYRGARVLAAYEPIRELGWGMVAKVDLAEIRAPFLRAVLIAGIVALVMIAVGAFVFWEMSLPLIRQLVESKSRTSAIMANVDVAVILADQHGVIELFNPAAEEMFGLRIEEAVGREVGILLPEPDRSRHAGYIARYLETGNSPLIGKGTHEGMGMRKDGALFPVELTVSEMFLEQQRLFIGIVRDLTERKRAQAELHEAEIARRTAERASRAKSEFLAAMSHELRTPLTGVLGLTQSIIRARKKCRMPDELEEKYLGKVIDSARHLTGIIDDLLDIASIEADKLKVNCEPVDFRQTMDMICSTFRDRVEGRGLALQVEISTDSLLVGADSKRLPQVFANLVGNALKFTESGFIRMAAQNWEEDDAYVLLSVADSGCGIPEEYLPCIFDRFVRAESSGAIPGVGLGLAITRRLVEMMGGRIWVESEVGRGSVFSFTCRKWQVNGGRTGSL